MKRMSLPFSFNSCRYMQVTCESDTKTHHIDLWLLDFGATYTFILGGVKDFYLSVVNVLPKRPWVYVLQFHGHLCSLESCEKFL